MQSRTQRVAAAALSSLLLAGAAAALAQPASYQGYGAESVAPETIARFAPAPLDPALARGIQAMLDVQAPGMGMLAPGGRKLYFAWRITGTQQLFRLDGPMGFPVQMTGGQDRTSIEAVSPDGRWLVLARDEDGKENPGLYLQPAGGGALRTVQKIDKVQTFFDFLSEDSRTLYFHSNDVAPDSYAIYRYDIATGTRTRIYGEKGLWAIADHQGRAEALRLLLVKSTGSFAREFALYTPATNRFEPLLGAGESTEYDARFGAHPGELLVRTNRFSDFRRLYRWKIGAPVQEDQFHPVLAPEGHDVEAFAIDDARRHLLATINDGGYARLAALDAHTFAATPVPLPADTDSVTVGASTPDGRFVTLGIESARRPRTSFVWDWQARRLVQWVEPSAPEVDLSQFVPARRMSYPARDGTRIPMFVRFPHGCAPEENPDADPCPVIVSFHGGPESQVRPNFSPGAQLFIDAGFILVQPNVRGSDGYGKAWLDADNGPRRLDIITDIDDAGKWVRANFARHGKAPKVGVTGGSYGGYSTLVAMTLFAGTYDAGASIVGMSNLVTFLRNTAPYRRILRISEYGDPDRDEDALRRLSPVTYLDRVSAPLLIIQGVNDPRVPAGEAIQMHDLLEKRGIPAPLILFADEGHGAAKRSNIVLQNGHVLQFFEQKLK